MRAMLSRLHSQRVAHFLWNSYRLMTVVLLRCLYSSHAHAEIDLEAMVLTHLAKRPGYLFVLSKD